MIRSILFAVLFACTASAANAQNITLSGKVKDTTANALVPQAVVMLLSPKDSIIQGFARTNKAGEYQVEVKAKGNYILMIMHPRFADFVDDISLNQDKNTYNQVPLTPKSKLLEAVIIKSGSPIKIKGDTTVYTADSFKVSANANVEELLKKLPGIQVDKNGEIKAMGEKVEKVLVDGEEFFGDDPGMAVKNLRADAVKEVQVFDKKSDQAEFTGIDDGQTKKTINLKLKEDKKKGYFGKISLAGGLMKNIDDRYNNNLLYGSFKGKRKLSAFLLQGNTGQDGLNWQDAQKYGGGDDNMNMEMDEDGGFMYSWRGGGIDDEPYVNTENGFIKNINAGLQYSNKWNADKHSLNFAPKFNLQDYNNYKTNYTQTFLGDSILNDNSNTISHVKRYNVRTSTVYDWKLDSANSIKLTVKANFYHTESEETINTTTTGKTGTLKNTQLRETSLNSDKQAINASLVFKHKFKKNRRTLSLNTDWNLLKTDATSFLNSDNITYLNNIPFDLQVNQMSDGNKTTQRFVAKAVYTEPLTKKWSMEISHEISVNAGNNNQAIYAYSPTSGKYDDQVDSLTNDFKQTIVQNKPAFKFNYAFKKLKVNLGSGFGFTKFDLLDRTTKLDYIRNYVNYFPTANLTYSYKSNHSLKFNYNGNTQQPNINQLQPLRNNNDQFNQYIGNPLLKPSFAQNFSLSHQSYNFKKDRWTYASVNATVTSNSITNSRIVDAATGKTTTQPVNTNGNLSMFTWSGMGFRNKKTNIRGMIALSGNYTRFADIINNQTSFSNTLGIGFNINLQKAKDKKYDFSLNNDINQNYNKNAQSPNTNKFLTLGVNANATIYYKKAWSIITDYRLYYQQKIAGVSEAFNNNILNARLQRTFKNNEYTVYVAVRDILNQNVGISRNYYGNSYYEENNVRLKRYFMVGFAWDFKNKAPQAKK